MANIGLPNVSIVFRGLGTSAVQRGSKGTAVLIIKDDTDKTFTIKEYTSVTDINTEEVSKYTSDNIENIKDVLKGTPKKLIVIRADSDQSLSDVLPNIRGVAPRNCWVGIADATQQEETTLISFIKSENTNNYKCYKALVYKSSTTDDRHIFNFSNENITFNDVRAKQVGSKAIPYLLGYFAGIPLNMSAIAKTLDIFKSVEEPSDLDSEINAGKLLLYNDEGKVRVARAINSLITTGQGITDDMKYMLIVEVMDMIYSDLYNTWTNNYKGRYKNNADNQALLIGAINAYFKGLANDLLLDENFENKAEIDIEQQRLDNIPKYGKELVESWDNDKVKEMTVGTNVYLKANIKILNAMEDFQFNISM